MSVPELNLTTDQILDLIETYDTPLQIYDETMIVDNAQNFLKQFESQFPGFKQYFAVKALPNPYILNILHSIGMGLDCSSASELFIADRLGIEDIMFSGNYVSSVEMNYAAKLQKSNSKMIINFDDIDGIDNLMCYGNNVPEVVCFRLNPKMGITDSETKSNILGGESSKFGIPEHFIVDAYKYAKFNGAKRFGIHTMTGSCVMNVEYWKNLVDTIFETVYRLKKELDINIEFINIGGGIGIPYKPDVKPVDIVELSVVLRRSFDENIERYGICEPKLYMENGRFITGSYGWLISVCQSIKKGYNNKIYYGLDACMANLMRPGMYGAYHHITVRKINSIDETDVEYEPVNVVGTLCENNDWFAKDRMLPKKIKKGDIFIIHCTGAHSHSMGFQYNGKLRATELIISRDGKIVMIRKGETVLELYDNCIF
jgi:diaminopimelate decarboxylase